MSPNLPQPQQACRLPGFGPSLVQQLSTLTLLLTTVLATPTMAQPASPPPQAGTGASSSTLAALPTGTPATLSVASLLATKEQQGTDPALARMLPLLQKALAAYRGFALQSTSQWQAQPGQVQKVSLPDGSELTLTFQGTEAGMLKLDLAIPPRLETSVRVSDGGTFFQAGLPFRNGMLVLAISARLTPPSEPVGK